MPKQSGIHQIKGKLGTVSYYGRKYSNTGFLRSINQELSERVKTAPNYMGTRSQNSKFRTCGNLLYCVTSGILNRQNYFLRPDFNAQILKFFRDRYIPYVGTDVTLERELRWRSALPGAIFELQKNRIDYFRGALDKCEYSYNFNPNTETAVLTFDIKAGAIASDIFRRYSEYSIDSLIEMSLFGVEDEGRKIPPYQYYESCTLDDWINGDIFIDESVTIDHKKPHVRYDIPANGFFLAVGIIPVINGVQYRSKASLSVFTVAEV